MINQVIASRYRIIKQLDKGGMGTVYVGEHIDLKQKVAIKILNQDARRNEGENRFINEAKTYASINHPNLVQLHDFETTSAYMAMVLEFCPGENLYQFIKKYAPLPIPLAVDIVIQIAQGLNAAHSNMILHRDLKPANIMLVPTTKEPKRYVVKLLDFGIAKDLNNNTNLTQQGMVCGTPEYMSPEQACGEKVSNACDIYALGVVFYEMLAGHIPFRDEVRQNVMLKHCQQIPPPLKNITPKLEQIVMRCLHKKAEDRYASTVDLIDALDMFTQDEYGYKAPIEIRTILQHKVEKFMAQRLAIKDEPPSQISMKMLSPEEIKQTAAEANIDIQKADAILEQIKQNSAKSYQNLHASLPHQKNSIFKGSMGIKHYLEDIWMEIQDKQKDPIFQNMVFFLIACLALLLFAFWANWDLEQTHANQIPRLNQREFYSNTSARQQVTNKQEQFSSSAQEAGHDKNHSQEEKLAKAIEEQKTQQAFEEQAQPIAQALPESGNQIQTVYKTTPPSKTITTENLNTADNEEEVNSAHTSNFGTIDHQGQAITERVLQVKEKYKFKNILKECDEIAKLIPNTTEITNLQNKCQKYIIEINFIKSLGCIKFMKKYEKDPNDWIGAVKKSMEFQEIIKKCKKLK